MNPEGPGRSASEAPALDCRNEAGKRENSRRCRPPGRADRVAHHGSHREASQHRAVGPTPVRSHSSSWSSASAARRREGLRVGMADPWHQVQWSPVLPGIVSGARGVTTCSELGIEHVGERQEIVLVRTATVVPRNPAVLGVPCRIGARGGRTRLLEVRGNHVACSGARSGEYLSWRGEPRWISATKRSSVPDPDRGASGVGSQHRGRPPNSPQAPRMGPEQHRVRCARRRRTGGPRDPGRDRLSRIALAAGRASGRGRAWSPRRGRPPPQLVQRRRPEYAEAPGFVRWWLGAHRASSSSSSRISQGQPAPARTPCGSAGCGSLPRAPSATTVAALDSHPA